MTRGTPPYRGLYRLPIAYAPTVLSNHTNDRASGLWRYFQIPFRPRYDTCACSKLTQNTNSGEAPILFQGLPNPSISYPGTTSTDFSRAFCVCFSRSLSQISLSLSCPSSRIQVSRSSGGPYWCVVAPTCILRIAFSFVNLIECLDACWQEGSYHYHQGQTGAQVRI